MLVTEQNTLRGVAFMVAAMFIFSAQDVLSRALAENHSPLFITMWRYWAFGAVCLVLLWREGFASGLRSGQPLLQIARGVGLALEICVAIMAFYLIGLAGTHAVFAFGPLLVVALSGPLLGERVGWRRWAAIMTLIGPWFWSVMTPFDALMMAALCATGMTGHFILIKALEAAEASAVQPFAYLQTVFSSLMGVLVFGEVVPGTTLLGGAIVIGAGLFAFWRERVRARQATREHAKVA